MAEEERRIRYSALAWCTATLVLLYAIGGAVFSLLERKDELAHYQRNRFMFQQMREMYEFDKCKEDWFKHADFCKKQKEFSGMLKKFFDRNDNELEDHGQWTFLGSAFFVSTLVTTMGYGNLHPRTPGGQLFTVFFGLIGIPVMGYVLSQIGRRAVKVWLPMVTAMDTRTRQVLVLFSFMVCLILFGGLVFSQLEDWSFLEACYFSACTLMSIGFGDYLPTHGASRAATMIFAMAGLGIGASFIALLQIHIEIRGELIAKQLNAWYGSVSENRATISSA
mmetsp:Transcript_1235/g.3014  ORF Transcript_1235/g.3014 Transcript_1235/m.3014 type:complete len:279 (-) Transcript_1235:137-973(-)